MKTGRYMESIELTNGEFSQSENEKTENENQSEKTVSDHPLITDFMKIMLVQYF